MKEFFAPDLQSPFQQLLRGVCTSTIWVYLTWVLAINTDKELLFVTLGMLSALGSAIYYAYVNNRFARDSAFVVWAILVLSAVFGLDAYVNTPTYVGHIWFVAVPVSIVWHSRINPWPKLSLYSILTAAEKMFVGIALGSLFPIVELVEFTLFSTKAPDMPKLVDGIVAVSILGIPFLIAVLYQSWFTDTHLAGWYFFVLTWWSLYVIKGYPQLTDPKFLIWIAFSACIISALFGLCRYVLNKESP